MMNYEEKLEEHIVDAIADKTTALLLSDVDGGVGSNTSIHQIYDRTEFLSKRIDAVRYCTLEELKARLDDPKELKTRLNLGKLKEITSSLLIFRVLLNTGCMIYNFAFVDTTGFGKYPPLAPWERFMVFTEFFLFCVYFGSSATHYLQFKLLAKNLDLDVNTGGEIEENVEEVDNLNPGLVSDATVKAYSHLAYSADALTGTAGFWFGMACPRMAYLYRFKDSIDGVLESPLSKSAKVLAIAVSTAISGLFLWSGFTCLLIYIRRSTYIYSGKEWTWFECCLFAALLNNLGSISDEERIKKNTFVDIAFAGEDGFLQGGEQEVVDTFMALVCQALVKRQGLFKGYLTYASLRSSDLQRLALKEKTIMPDCGRNTWRMLGNSLQRAWVPPILIFFIGNAIHFATELGRRATGAVRRSGYVHVLPDEFLLDDQGKAERQV